MRAIIEINPTLSGGRLTEWMDISHRITSSAKIRRQFRSSKWSYGVAAISFSKLTVENEDGMFSPPSDYRSIFRNSPMGQALFRVRYGGTAENPEREVFAGTVSSRTSESDMKNNRAELVVKSVGSALADIDPNEEVSPGVKKLNIQGDRTRELTLAAIFGIPEVDRIVRSVGLESRLGSEGAEINTNALFQGSEQPAGGVSKTSAKNVKPSIVKDGDSVLDVLNRFLEVEDALFIYNYRYSQWVVAKRGVMPSPKVIYVDDVLEMLGDSDGSRDVINEVIFTPPLEFYKDNTPPLDAFYDADLASTKPLPPERNEASISAYGLRSINIDASFLTPAYFYNRLLLGFRNGDFLPQERKRRVKFMADLNQPESPNRINENDWGLGEYLYLDPKPLVQDNVPTVSDKNPVSPTLVKRDLFDPSVGVDGTGILFKAETSRLFNPNGFYNPPTQNNLTFADTRWLTRTGAHTPIRRSSDGSLAPAYLGQIRFWRRGEPGIRIILIPDPDATFASGGAVRAANVLFQDTYYPDLRLIFRIENAVYMINAQQTGTRPDNRGTQNAAITALLAAMDNNYPNPDAKKPGNWFAIVDSKALNIDENDPTRVIIANKDAADRLPFFVSGNSAGEDATNRRRT